MPAAVAAANQCLDCEVRTRSVCACLSNEDLAVLDAVAKRRRFLPGETILMRGQPAPCLHIVVSGMVRLYRQWPDRQRRIVSFALPGEFVDAALGVEAPFSADAIGPVLTCSLPRESFVDLADSRPHMMHQLQASTMRVMRMAQEQLLLLGRHSAEERMVSFLLDMRSRWSAHGPLSVTVPLPMSRQDIADYLGLTIETVSRTLSRLAREKAIVIVPGGVRLLDLARLTQIAAG